MDLSYRNTDNVIRVNGEMIALFCLRFI
jgi:hypothetical protein